MLSSSNKITPGDPTVVTLKSALPEELLEDVETVLEDNDPLEYFDSNNIKQSTAQTTILSIDTDEGVLEPLGIGEIVCEIRY